MNIDLASAAYAVTGSSVDFHDSSFWTFSNLKKFTPFDTLPIEEIYNAQISPVVEAVLVRNNNFDNQTQGLVETALEDVTQHTTEAFESLESPSEFVDKLSIDPTTLAYDFFLNL